MQLLGFLAHLNSLCRGDDRTNITLILIATWNLLCMPTHPQQRSHCLGYSVC